MAVERKTPELRYHTFITAMSRADATKVANVTGNHYRMNMWASWNAETTNYDVICEASLRRGEINEIQLFVNGVAACITYRGR